MGTADRLVLSKGAHMMKPRKRRGRGSVLALALRVCLVIACVLPWHSAQTVRAQTSSPQRIAPALLTAMTASPTALLPVIVEMNEATASFGTTPHIYLAQQAVTLLQTYAQAVGGLEVIDGAAGHANAAGIQAMSLLSHVAIIDQDAVVQPVTPGGTGTVWPPGQIGSLYAREV